MRNALTVRRANLLFILFLGLGLTACKKNKSNPTDGSDELNTKQTPTTNRVALSNDSLFLYAKQIYYWNSALPSYDTFDPRQYTTKGSNLLNYEDNLYNIVKASNSPDYVAGSSFPKYSYIDDITTSNPQATAPNSKASVDLEGNGYDIGIRPVSYLFTSAESGAYGLFVTAVYPGSPAATAGVKRGWLIQKINGIAYGTSYSAETAAVQAALAGSTVRLQGVKYISGVASGSFDVNLNKSSYKSSPVYLAKTLTAGTKKVGYVAFARFSTLAGNAKAALDEAFSSFTTGSVTDLIVDLRYNGGGYVNTSEYFANLIAPADLNGKVMFKEYYNSTMQSGKASIMAHQPVLDDNGKIRYQSNGKILTYADIDYSPAQQTTLFKKEGSFTGVQSVTFIVTRNTASASELLINNLKPYLKVIVVGEKTYGKPIGFFPIRLENRYDVLFSLFESKNSKDEGGYFTGITPDYADTGVDASFYDDPGYDFGDVKEKYLAKAISVIPGSGLPVIGSTRGTVMSINGREISISNQNVAKPVKQNDEFIGMIETRLKHK